MRPLTYLAGVVISNKTLADSVIEDIIDNSVENHLVYKSRGLDKPFFWLIDFEQLKLAGAVCFGKQDFREPGGASEGICLILSRPRFLSLPFPRLQVRCIEGLKTT